MSHLLDAAARPVPQRMKSTAVSLSLVLLAAGGLAGCSAASGGANDAGPANSSVQSCDTHAKAKKMLRDFRRDWKITSWGSEVKRITTDGCHETDSVVVHTRLYPKDSNKSAGQAICVGEAQELGWPGRHRDALNIMVVAADNVTPLGHFSPWSGKCVSG